MHPNIAQITRTWVATSLVTGKIHDTNIISTPDPNTIQSFSPTSSSIPIRVIDWTSNIYPHHNYQSHKVNFSHDDESQISHESDMENTPPKDINHHNSSRHEANEQVAASPLSTQSHSQNMPPSSSLEPVLANTTDTNSSPQRKQENIMKWTVNCSSRLHNNEAPFLQPFGHDLQQIDPTRTL
jgi:hypothetical protein